MQTLYVVSPVFVVIDVVVVVAMPGDCVVLVVTRRIVLVLVTGVEDVVEAITGVVIGPVDPCGLHRLGHGILLNVLLESTQRLQS